MFYFIHLIEGIYICVDMLYHDWCLCIYLIRHLLHFRVFNPLTLEKPLAKPKLLMLFDLP